MNTDKQKFTFIGCSITKGVGLPNEDLDENNYTNIVGNYFNAEIINLSKGGNSNYNIFIDGVNQLLYNKPDVLLLQWSGLQRHWLYPNLDVKFLIVNGALASDLNYLDTVFSKKVLQKFTEQFLLLNHDYHNILALLNYCKILETIAGDQTRLIFINGLLPWTKEIQYKQAVTNPAKNFSEYTKNLLSINMLPDEDIELFFNKIHNGLTQINKNKWINMFQSIPLLLEDLGTDNSHPGPETHAKIAQMIINHITK
jgi:lysophospholipase L1-like esterase